MIHFNVRKAVRGKLVFLAVFLLVALTSPAFADGNGAFVERQGSKFMLNGEEFTYAGTNNYYLMYTSNLMVDDMLETAAYNGFDVVRTWGFMAIGNEDGSNSIAGIQNGIYFQYWDGNGPAYNDDADGLENLDYVLYKAGQEGIKLIVPLTNNWADFGGMDQYVRWADGDYHDDFYTDPQIRQWYKEYIDHLLNRTNIYTGIQYKDDPTIMAWELANEPRCGGSGAYPRSPECGGDTLIEWADEMSAYIKTVDSNHLVAVGDEGFYCDDDPVDYFTSCGDGVDSMGLSSLPNIDYMSFHLYPDHWGTDVEWSTNWIARHALDGQRINKPVVLGEYGFHDQSIRNPVFKEWTDTAMEMGVSGIMYWILSGIQDDGSLYPDYDGFTVYCPSPVCITLNNLASMMSNGKPAQFPPVADHDSAVTEFETAVSLTPAANDIAYGYNVPNATAVASTIDLDPSTSGQQTSVSVVGGTFSLEADGSVLFTPDLEFSGTATTSYTIQDNRRRLSNQAELEVIVKPSPTAAVVIASFETGTEGFASADWQDNAGTTSQTDSFATDGSYSLQVDSADGGWFGLQPGSLADLTGKSVLHYDLQTNGAGTSTNVALILGDGWEWCQGEWGYVNGGSTATVEIDLLNLGCNNPDLSQVQGIYIWVSGGGTFQIDYVRGES